MEMNYIRQEKLAFVKLRLSFSPTIATAGINILFTRENTIAVGV